MKKVLLITDVPFWVKAAGHQMRISGLVEFLSVRVELSIIYLGDFDPSINILQKTVKADVHVFSPKYIFPKIPIKRYATHLNSFLKKKQFNTYILEYIHLSYLIKSIPFKSNVFLDMHDIISERCDSFKEYNYKPIAGLTEKKEIKTLMLYNKVILICQPDYDKIKNIIGADRPILCSHPVKIVKHEIRKDVKNIGFIASSYQPNRDAILHFLECCWNKILVKHKVNLFIYGHIKRIIDVSEYANVSVMGYVENTNKIYEDLDIIINPVRFGAGIKIKNLEALGHGKPLVTTSHGARGISAITNSILLIADSSQEFVDAISALIEDYSLRKQLSENAQDFISTHFSEDRCFDPLLSEIEKLER